MLLSYRNRIKRSKDIEEYICPWTIIYKLDATKSNYYYSFGLKNVNNPSSMLVDWR